MLIQEILEKLTRELIYEKEIMMKKKCANLGGFLKTKTWQKVKMGGAMRLLKTMRSSQ